MALAACGPGGPPGDATIEPWPFTVDWVVLSCSPVVIPEDVDDQARRILRERGARVYVSAPDGVRYAVNGTARSDAPLMRDIQAIVDTSPLIERGLALCHGDRGGAVRLVRPSTEAEARPATALPSPTYRLEPSQLGHGYFATAQANEDINGTRPDLTLACERGRAPTVMLDLVQEPRTPPPLLGVYATFDTGDNEPRQIEMSWGLHGDWILRSGDERAADTDLARAILTSGRVTLRGAPGYMPDKALTWDFSGFGDDLDRIRRECGVS